MFLAKCSTPRFNYEFCFSFFTCTSRKSVRIVECGVCGVFRINTRLNTLRILVKRKSKSQTEIPADQIKANKVGIFHANFFAFIIITSSAFFLWLIISYIIQIYVFADYQIWDPSNPQILSLISRENFPIKVLQIKETPRPYNTISYTTPNTITISFTHNVPSSLSRDIRWHVRVPIDNGQRNCKSKQNVVTKECAGGEAEGAENPPWPLAKSTVAAAYSISDRKTNLKYGKQKRNEKSEQKKTIKWSGKFVVKTETHVGHDKRRAEGRGELGGGNRILLRCHATVLPLFPLPAFGLLMLLTHNLPLYECVNHDKVRFE